MDRYACFTSIFFEFRTRFFVSFCCKLSVKNVGKIDIEGNYCCNCCLKKYLLSIYVLEEID